jgi:hypothetical protein
MSNRLSQIIKGTKGIQTYDLPIFTALLGVSCEQLLSAGEIFVPISNRVTNYSVAFSHDVATWESYINREDKLILNSDEYGKTVIDYSLEFKNYALLKHLVKNGYIWFVKQDTKSYGLTFGAGTSIDCRYRKLTHDFVQVDFPENPLKSILAEQDCLRMKLITLAIEHDDIDMLNELKAREIPSLYQASYLSCRSADCSSYYNEDMVKALSGASDMVLDYFSQEFEILDVTGKHPNTFMFPFLSNLLDLIIPANNKFAETVLMRAYEHNKKTYDTLQGLIRESVKSHPAYKYYFDNDSDALRKQLRNDITNYIKRELEFFDDGDVVLFRFAATYKGIITNIFHTNATAPALDPLIEKLNVLYNRIWNYKLEVIQVLERGR